MDERLCCVSVDHVALQWNQVIVFGSTVFSEVLDLHLLVLGQYRQVAAAVHASENFEEEKNYNEEKKRKQMTAFTKSEHMVTPKKQEKGKQSNMKLL